MTAADVMRRSTGRVDTIRRQRLVQEDVLMAKLVQSDNRGFEFTTAAGRRYVIPFGRRIQPRGPRIERDNGMLGKVRDNGNGRPKAQWITNPKTWLELETLEREYDISGFAIDCKPLPPVQSPRAAREPVEQETDQADEQPDEPTADRHENVATSMVVDGWTMALVEGEEEPRVGAFEVAERAGMRAPRQVKELLARHSQELEKHGPLYMRRTVRRISKPNGGAELREVEEPMLNEAQAIHLVALMRTEKAAEIRGALVRVFVAYRKGAIQPVQSAMDPTAAALFAGQQEILKSLAGSTQRLEVNFAELRDTMDQKIEAEAARAVDRGLQSIGQSVAGPIAAAAGATVETRDALSLTEVLRDVGLPWERGPRGPLFGPVVFTAIDMHGYKWEKGVQRPVLEQVRPSLIVARDKFNSMGWKTLPTGFAWFCGPGRKFQLETVIKRIREAMRGDPSIVRQSRLPYSGEP